MKKTSTDQFTELNTRIALAFGVSVIALLLAILAIY